MRCYAVFISIIFSLTAIGQDSQKEIYCEFPVAAVFPAKYVSLQKFIAEKFVQPDAVPDSSFTKKGRIKFVIEKNGIAGKFEILERLGYGCDEEIIRILKLVKWKPAVFRGRRTNDTRMLPYTIIFERSNSSDIFECSPGSNLDISLLSASFSPPQKPLEKYG
jgi:hypothetical protein